MADITSVDLARLSGGDLEQASPDLLRAMVETFAEALMGAEADAVCGAGYGERSDERTNTRNGYRWRGWDTRAGTRCGCCCVAAGVVEHTRVPVFDKRGTGPSDRVAGRRRWRCAAKVYYEGVRPGTLSSGQEGFWPTDVARTQHRRADRPARLAKLQDSIPIEVVRCWRKRKRSPRMEARYSQ